MTNSNSDINETDQKYSHVKINSDHLEAVTSFAEQIQKCSRVKVILTGGTISMIRDENGILAPTAVGSNLFVEHVREIPELHDKEFAGKYLQLQHPLVLQKVPGLKRVLYFIQELGTLQDSCNMTMDDWIQLGLLINEHYDNYDGFVILHGTDTLAYTASALSFLLENLGKTVIVTGSQISIFDSRTDGVNNFVTSLLLAGNFPIPEVTVYANNLLLRGNRTVKADPDNFGVYDSPNFPPLATAGVNIKVNYQYIFQPYKIEKFHVHSNLNRNVALLRLFPAIFTDLQILSPPVEGLVIETYGAGNVPSNRSDLIDLIRKAVQRGVIIINCSQCYKGIVMALYETGQVLYDAGVLPGQDMTSEAALTKLAYVLSKNEWDLKTKKMMMLKNIRGELTTSLKCNQSKASYENISFNIFDRDKVLLPAMMCLAANEGDIERVGQLIKYGISISATNCDGRTPLHLACANGNKEMVEFLLMNGANVNAQDRRKHTPLTDAVLYEHEELIKLLLLSGAHLTFNQQETANELYCAVTTGNVARVRAFQLAGASLMQKDATGRTPLHLAVICNQMDVIKYLLSANVTKDIEDVLGFTPLDLAVKLNFKNIIDLLQ